MQVGFVAQKLFSSELNSLQKSCAEEPAHKPNSQFFKTFVIILGTGSNTSYLKIEPPTLKTLVQLI